MVSGFVWQRRQDLSRLKCGATFVCLFALILAGCTSNTWESSKTASTSPTNQKDAPASDTVIPGVLRQPLTMEPISIDPGLVLDNSTYDVIQQVYEGLTGITEKNEVVPLLAESMPTVSPDGKTYTFVLRKGVRFTNGRDLTAKDVQFSILRMLDPALSSPTAMIELDDIVGAKEVSTGKAKELVGLTVVDDRTIRFRLVGPRPYFPGKLATVYIVAEEEVAKGPKNEAGAHLIDATNSVGTGPYKLLEYSRQQKITLVANPDYWGGKPPLERIERPILLDVKTIRNLYDTGQLDLIVITPAAYSSLRDDPVLKDQVHINDRALATFVQLSQKQYAPFRDRRVRQALALATDRDAIVQDVLYKAGVKAESLLPPGLPGYSPTFLGLPHDVERAKRLLAEAGYSKDKPLPPFTFLYTENQPVSVLVVQSLQEQWAAAGITVNLRGMEGGALQKAILGRDYDAVIGSWSPNYPDPQGIFSALLLPGSVGNYSGYDSSAFKTVCQAADTTPNSPRRWQLYEQAMRIARDDSPLIPLYFMGEVNLVSPHVSGLRESLIWRLPHTRTRVRE